MLLGTTCDPELLFQDLYGVFFLVLFFEMSFCNVVRVNEVFLILIVIFKGWRIGYWGDRNVRETVIRFAALHFFHTYEVCELEIFRWFVMINCYRCYIYYAVFHLHFSTVFSYVLTLIFSPSLLSHTHTHPHPHPNLHFLLPACLADWFLVWKEGINILKAACALLDSSILLHCLSYLFTSTPPLPPLSLHLLLFLNQTVAISILMMGDILY